MMAKKQVVIPEVMKIDQAAEFLQIPISTLYKLAQDGRLPARKVGRHWRFSRRGLESWVAMNGKGDPPAGDV